MAMVLALAGLAPAQSPSGWVLTGPQPLVVTLGITGTVPPDTPTRTAEQTLTFTFGQPVSGFEASDVQLEGARGGTFITQSPTTYTMEVTATKGLARVTVPTGAAMSATAIPTQAATFQFFYQASTFLPMPDGNTMEFLLCPPPGLFGTGGAKAADPVAWTSIIGSPESELSRKPDERQHEARFLNDIWVGSTEVTQLQWLSVTPTWPGAAPREEFGLGNQFPAYNVSWQDTQAYIAAYLSYLRSLGPDFTFMQVRLVTEAEWEGIASASPTLHHRFAFGDGLGADELCSAEQERLDGMWYCGNSQTPGAKAGLKAPSYYGFYNTNGNVAEWVSDWYGDYPTSSLIAPTGPKYGTEKIIRGGAWNSNASDCRSAARAHRAPTERSPYVGFRLVFYHEYVTLDMAALSGVAAEGRPGGVSTAGSETIRFDFSHPVTGFTASDVLLTGASAGTFTVVSPTQYTLVVNHTGGPVEVTVPRGAALPVSNPTVTPGVASEGAGLSYNFRPPVVLNLPGAVPLELVPIPAGSFTMGSPLTETGRGVDEALHNVTLTRDYLMGKFEITQRQWLAIMGSFPVPQRDGNGDNLALQNVSWEDAQAFATALNVHLAATGQGLTEVRLPTEAEWEYACRAGSATRFGFGEGLGSDDNCATTAERTENMWYCGNSGGVIQAVGLKPANALGLHDMHGNAFEAVSDWYANYPAPSETDPTGPATGVGHVVRSGTRGDGAAGCRSARRFNLGPTFRGSATGFRLAADRLVGLAITASGVGNGGVTDLPETVLTLTFSEAVTGFDASDIVLTGATPGTFTAVSPTVYTLEVTAPVQGGVTAAVGRAAATSAAGGRRSASATFAYTYSTARTVYLPGGTPMLFEHIPAGSFQMGSPPGETSRFDIETQHPVTLTRTFYMAKYEVTQRQWLALMGTWPGQAFNQFPTAAHGLGDNYPAYYLCWDDAQAYVSALNAYITSSLQDPFTVRLPTEAEWEYSCRAQATTRFAFGDALGTDEACSAEPERTDNLWFCGNNAPAGTKLVGLKPPNAFGLQDMHGNVTEWCQDYYGLYPPGAATDPTGPATGGDRIVRGGSHQAQIRFCRAAHRPFSSPGGASRFTDSGFRLAGDRP